MARTLTCQFNINKPSVVLCRSVSLLSCMVALITKRIKEKFYKGDIEVVKSDIIRIVF